MRSYRHLLVMAAVLAVAVSLGGCSSSSSSAASSVVSSAAATLEHVKVTVCRKLDDASTAVRSFQVGQTDQWASTASTLSSDLQNASSTLRTVGASSVADDVSSLATDIQDLAGAAPDDADAMATGVQTEITNAEAALACPG